MARSPLPASSPPTLHLCLDLTPEGKLAFLGAIPSTGASLFTGFYARAVDDVCCYASIWSLWMVDTVELSHGTDSIASR